MAALTGVGCEITQPQGGGQNHDSGPCSASNDAAWGASNASIQVTKPPCPYTWRNTNDYVPFAVSVSLPEGSKDPNLSFNPTAGYEAVDKYSWTTVSSLYNQSMSYANGAYSVQLSQCCSMPELWTEPGNPNHASDSLIATISGIDPGQFQTSDASAWKLITGDYSPYSQNLLGPSSLIANQTGTWRMQTYWDTSGYDYNWVIDGSPAAWTSNQISTHFLTAGNHTVKSIATLSDNVADTVTQTLNVDLGVTISGPTSLQYNTGGTWTASVSGGSGNYSYSWANDYGASGSTDTLHWVASACGAADITLNVSDDAGHVGFARQILNVSGSGCMQGPAPNRRPLNGKRK